MVSATVFAQVPAAGDGSDAGGPALPPLSGQIDGDMYTSATGAFRIRIPVLPELGGVVTDTSNVVIFQDPFSTYISIAAFPQDPTEKWKYETMGVKDYLKDFFINYVLRDFRRANAQAQVELNARFLPNVKGGAFITYLTIPGGSMFAGHDAQIEPDAKPAVAKRGNMLFVHDGYIYVISTELAERVTEGTAYKGTSEHEDEVLRDRLLDVAGRIRFLKPSPAP